MDVAVSHVFYSWVFGFGGKVKIAGPEEVKEEYREMVKKAAEEVLEINMQEKEDCDMGVLWATFQVTDMEKSLAFYNGILGMPVRERFSAPQDGAEIVMLGEDGGGLLELISRGAPKMPGQGVSIGLPFMDLEAIGETLVIAGYTPTPIIAPMPGVRFRFVNDPDGYQIQLVER